MSKKTTLQIKQIHVVKTNYPVEFKPIQKIILPITRKNQKVIDFIQFQKNNNPERAII